MSDNIGRSHPHRSVHFDGHYTSVRPSYNPVHHPIISMAAAAFAEWRNISLLTYSSIL